MDHAEKRKLYGEKQENEEKGELENKEKCRTPLNPKDHRLTAVL